MCCERLFRIGKSCCGIPSACHLCPRICKKMQRTRNLVFGFVLVVTKISVVTAADQSQTIPYSNYTCPVGSFRNLTVDQDTINPDFCAPGQTAIFDDDSDLEWTCTDCPPGTYKDVYGTSPCILCPPGTFSDTNGSDCVMSCLTCPRHSHSTKAGSVACDCDAGYEMLSGPAELSIPSPATREAWQESR
jgi:hypothetical protein